MRRPRNRLLDKIISSGEKIILYLESPEIPFSNYLWTFLAIITLRNVREYFYTSISITNHLPAALHFNIGYIIVCMTLVLWFQVLTKESIVKSARVILPLFIVLWFVPSIDFIYSFYLKRMPVTSYVVIPLSDWLRYFTFLWEPGQIGVTPGMRIELGLVFGVSFFYIYFKTRKLGRSLGGALGGYALIAAYITNPMVMFLNPSKSADFQMYQFYLFLILGLGGVLFYRAQKLYFWAIIKDLRLTRIFHFELMFFIGFLCQRSHTMMNGGEVFNIFFMSAAILFACLYALMINNCADVRIDSVSNKERPLVTGAIPQATYQRISQVFLVLALIYASAVSIIHLFCVAAFMGNYYLYSMPPLRLKRLPVLSKSLIAINSFLLFLAGFSWGGPKMPEISSLTLLISFLVFTLVLNFIDIKDYAGDKAAGIKTLPTLLGLEKSKQLIGLFFIGTYLYSAFLLGQGERWVFFLILGVIQFFLINRKNYREEPVFFVYLASVIYIMIRTFWG